MNDLISRQNAIDALGEEPLIWHEGEDEIAERNQWRRDVNAIRAVPSAQPELIRCKDCKHWHSDADAGMACDYTNMAQPEDGFCNWAERKTNAAN